MGEFYLVTVTIGTICQLVKISIPKEERDSKQNKTNNWGRQRDLAVENSKHLFMCMHGKDGIFLESGEIPKMR